VLGDGVSKKSPVQAVTWLHVDELRPNPRNPRKHGPEVLKLARTILRTTWGAPIVVQARSHRIIGGHGRLEAAREILAGIEVDGELRGGSGHLFSSDAPAPGMVPVRVVDVSDAEADAMTLADNARSIQGHDDAAMIVEMASMFERDAAIMADIGLGADALDALVRQAGDAVIASATIDASSAFGALPDSDKAPFQTMTFVLHDSQADIVKRALEAAKDAGDFDDSPNENSNGNALSRIAEAFLGG
jgi:hypothetical protein